MHSAGVFFFHVQPQQSIRVFLRYVINKLAANAKAAVFRLDINILQPDALPAVLGRKALGRHAIALHSAVLLKHIALYIRVIADTALNVPRKDFIRAIAQHGG